MRTIRLTDDQASLLKMYVLLSTKHREREIEAWTSMGTERGKDGAIAFPNAVSNAEWWTNAHASLAEILKLLDAARETAPKMPCRGPER